MGPQVVHTIGMNDNADLTRQIAWLYDAEYQAVRWSLRGAESWESASLVLVATYVVFCAKIKREFVGLFTVLPSP